MSTHTTRPPPRRAGPAARRTARRGRCPPGAGRSTSTRGQPVPLDRARRRPPAAPRPAPRATGRARPARRAPRPARARSTATSRACQVGARSCCQRSSCSSRTTTAARSDTGAHAAGPGPDHGGPGAGPGPSPAASSAAPMPARPSRRARCRAPSAEGTRIRALPRARPPPARRRRCRRRAPGAPRPGRGQGLGGQRVVRPGRGRPAGSGRGQDRARRVSGEAVRSSWAGRPAQRQAPQSASVDQLGRGPQPVTLAIGARVTPAGGSTSTLHHPGAHPTAVQGRRAPSVPTADVAGHGARGRCSRTSWRWPADRAAPAPPERPARGRRRPRRTGPAGAAAIGRAPGRFGLGRREREGQSPSAERSSSTLSVRSQVKPPSSAGRPK